MDHSFILKNQDGHYWGRSKEWVDGSDRSRVAQYKHRDEASNMVFELSSKDFGLRAEILKMTLKDGKIPKLTISQIALPGLEEDIEVDSAEAGDDLSELPIETPGESSGERSGERENAEDSHHQKSATDTLEKNEEKN